MYWLRATSPGARTPGGDPTGSGSANSASNWSKWLARRTNSSVTSLRSANKASSVSRRPGSGLRPRPESSRATRSRSRAELSLGRAGLRILALQQSVRSAPSAFAELARQGLALAHAHLVQAGERGARRLCAAPLRRPRLLVRGESTRLRQGRQGRDRHLGAGRQLVAQLRAGFRRRRARALGEKRATARRPLRAARRRRSDRGVRRSRASCSTKNACRSQLVRACARARPESDD